MEQKISCVCICTMFTFLSSIVNGCVLMAVLYKTYVNKVFMVSRDHMLKWHNCLNHKVNLRVVCDQSAGGVCLPGSFQ